MGHGAVQKVEHSVNYDKMEPDKLIPILRSKLARLAELNPSFTPERLLAEQSMPGSVSDSVSRETYIDAELESDD